MSKELSKPHAEAIGEDIAGYMNELVDCHPDLEVVQFELAMTFTWIVVSNPERYPEITERLVRALIVAISGFSKHMRIMRADYQQVIDKTEEERNLLTQGAKVKGHPEDYYLDKSQTVEEAVSEWADMYSHPEKGFNVREFMDAETKNLGKRGGASDDEGAYRQKLIRDLCDIFPPDDSGVVSKLIGDFVSKLLGGNPKTNKDTAQRILKQKRIDLRAKVEL